MKETTTTMSFITPDFSPTMKLRWFINDLYHILDDNGNVSVKEEKVLQQLWQSSNGIYEWRDIEIETINIKIMKTFEITKEQIKQLYASDNASYLLKIMFPAAFETELEVGKWYKAKTNYLFDWLMNYQEDNTKCYGFNSSKIWINEYKMEDKYKWIPATPQEVESALIAEAKRRGYKDGNYKCLDLPQYTERNVDDSFFLENGKLWHGNKGRANVCFQRGQWASIIPQMTKEQIEKELGYKIEIV
jgi:hypothetical protein